MATFTDQSPRTPTGSTSGSQLSQQGLEIIMLDKDDGEGDARRSTRWRYEDDELLISAWLNIPKDPIVENDQKVDSFWKRVAEYYKEHRNGGVRRTSNQMKQHWHKMNQAVIKFDGFYRRVSQRHQSGMSEKDIINRAQQLYEDEIGKKFIFEHAWRLLKDEPKWRACRDTSGNNSSSKRTNVFESRVYTSSYTNVPTSKDVGVSEECEVSPIGQKAAKKKAKEKLPEKSATDFQARFEKRRSLEEERNSAIMHFSRVKEKEIEVKQKEIETKILLADTASMTPLQREIHEKMLKEILEKYK